MMRSRIEGIDFLSDRYGWMSQRSELKFGLTCEALLHLLISASNQNALCEQLAEPSIQFMPGAHARHACTHTRTYSSTYAYTHVRTHACTDGLVVETKWFGLSIHDTQWCRLSELWHRHCDSMVHRVASMPMPRTIPSLLTTTQAG